MYKLSLQHSTLATTVSQHCKDDIIRFYKVNPNKIHVIPGNPSFIRGLSQFNNHSFFVGSKTPAIYLVDLNIGQIVSSFLIDGEPYESVYGISIIPDTFDNPPSNQIINEQVIFE